MERENDSPHIAFKDLQYFIHQELYNELEEFYSDVYSGVANTDYENYIVTTYEGEYSLEHNIILKGLETKIENCISNYEALILEDIHNSKKVQNYKNFFTEQIDNIFNHY